MARSLIVKHDEPAATSPLLTGFLLLAIAWLALGSLTTFSAEAAPGGAVDLSAE